MSDGAKGFRANTITIQPMKDEQRIFLSLWSQPPARLSVEQAAWALNFQPHDIPVLVASKILKPLGSPPANGLKFFAATEVMELSKDSSWLARATNAIHQHWHRKNLRKRGSAGATSGEAA